MYCSENSVEMASESSENIKDKADDVVQQILYSVVDEDEQYVQVVLENWLTPHPTLPSPTKLMAFPKKNATNLLKKGKAPEESWPRYTVKVMKKGITSE